MIATDKAEALAYWQRHNIAAGAKPRPCPHCGHSYYRPCNEAEHAICQNFLAAQRKAAKATKDITS